MHHYSDRFRLMKSANLIRCYQLKARITVPIKQRADLNLSEPEIIGGHLAPL